MKRRHALLLLGLLLASACHDAPTSPDATTTSTTSNVVFEGSLDPNAASFYSFQPLQSGTVTINLASLNLVGHREALAVPVRIGVGVPRGVGCAESESIDTVPALVSQFSTAISTGIHCVNIADVGNLPGAATFLIRFSYQ